MKGKEKQYNNHCSAIATLLNKIRILPSRDRTIRTQKQRQKLCELTEVARISFQMTGNKQSWSSLHYYCTLLYHSLYILNCCMMTVLSYRQTNGLLSEHRSPLKWGFYVNRMKLAVYIQLFYFKWQKGESSRQKKPNMYREPLWFSS